MKELYASLDEALKNLEMASSSLNGMYRIGAPSSCINHMSQSVTTWQNRVADLRAQVQNALAAEGAAGVGVVAIIAEPTPADLMTAKIETVRQIASEEVTITRGELHNLIRLAAAELRRQEAFDKTHSSNAIKSEHETARRIFDQTVAGYEAMGEVPDLSIYFANKGWIAVTEQLAVAA